MKTNTTFDRFSVRALPTGRRSLVAQRTQDEVGKVRSDGDLTPAQDAGLGGVVSACDAITAHGKTCAALERGFLASKLTPSTNAAVTLPIDRQADRTVSGLYDAAKPFIKGFSPSEPEHNAAVVFQRSAFPKGVKYVTQASYPEQLQRMEDLLSYCRSDQGAPQVQTLGLGVWVQKLADLLPGYKAAVQSLPPTAAVSYGQLQGAWRDGHVLLCQLVQSVFSAFPAHTPQDDLHRARLLSHLSAQENIVADMYRRRTSLKDIDPDTGHEVDTLEVNN